MTAEGPRTLPIITRMPVIKPEVLETLRVERQQGGERYFWSLGATFAHENPQHREGYQEAVRNGSATTPDATSGTVLFVLHALELQAQSEGFQLPQIPRSIDPTPALRGFMRRSDGTDLDVINMAYDELVRTNPVIGDIVREMQVGATDELLRIMTETQAKRGAVYAFYGVKSLLDYNKIVLDQIEQELHAKTVISPATRDDLLEIWHILRETVQNPYGSGNVDEGEFQADFARLTETLDTDGEDQILIAKNRQGQALGFAFIGKPDSRMTDFSGSDPKTTLELKLLYLDPIQRKKGIGSQLLEEVEKVARAQGKSKIELTSGPRYLRIGTGEFYFKKGFTRLVGKIDNYFDNRYSARVFQKNLS